MDVMQMAVYIGGAFIAGGIILTHLPNGLESALKIVSQQEKLHFIDAGFHLSLKEFFATPYTFFTALVGGGIFSIASHGTDQLIVQRLLTTKNLKSSQKALIGSGFIIFLQFALFLGIGLLLFGFYGGQSPEQLGLATTDEIFAKFIVEQLPTGLSGLIVAALFAAAMSSLSSSLNSLASATSLDLYKPYWGKKNTPEQDLQISRIITVIWGLILTASAFLFAFLQLNATGERPAVVELGLSIASYTYGGLLGAFLLGILFEKPARIDALFGFFTGLISLLFLVEGPIQNILPGEGLAIAWPLYTVVGAFIVVVVANVSYLIRHLKEKVQ
jgi:Na+/proline symporter